MTAEQLGQLGGGGVALGIGLTGGCDMGVQMVLDQFVQTALVPLRVRMGRGTVRELQANAFRTWSADAIHRYDAFSIFTTERFTSWIHTPSRVT